MTVDPDSGDVISIVPLNGLTFSNLAVGELNIEIANSQVLKQVPLLSFVPEFNKSATHEQYYNFEFDTQLVINPLLEFVFPTRVNTYTPVVNAFIRLTIEGTGAIISPRATF